MANVDLHSTRKLCFFSYEASLAWVGCVALFWSLQHTLPRKFYSGLYIGSTNVSNHFLLLIACNCKLVKSVYYVLVNWLSLCIYEDEEESSPELEFPANGKCTFLNLTPPWKEASGLRQCTFFFQYLWSIACCCLCQQSRKQTMELQIRVIF